MHLALPAVDRLHLREYLHARGQVRADEHLGQPRRLLLTPRRQQHNYRRRIRVHSYSPECKSQSAELKKRCSQFITLHSALPLHSSFSSSPSSSVAPVSGVMSPPKKDS